jgi:transcriptional regulator with XRE-family HTH domain
VAEPPAPDHTAEPSFSQWFRATLSRGGLAQEAAARQLGVSVKTVSRWARGETEPGLKHLRRIHEVLGETPIPQRTAGEPLDRRRGSGR